MDTPLLVSVVDDDESVRESLPDLLREFGFRVKAYSSSLEFLSSDVLDSTSCLILDVTMPQMSGPELQKELIGRGYSIPIIFISAQEDYARRARLMSFGAVDCLTKPFSETALLTALSAALPVD